MKNPFDFTEAFNTAMSEYRAEKEETVADVLDELNDIMKINREQIEYLSTSNANGELRLAQKLRTQLEFYTKAVAEGTIDPVQARNIIRFILEHEHKQKTP